MVDLLSGENLSLTAIRKGDKVKFVGNAATNSFPKLQGLCTTAKTALTKAMTSLEKASSGFENLTTEDGLLTSQRFARTYMAALEKVDNKKTNLENCCKTLIEHVHGMARDEVAEVELKLQEQERLVKKAKHILSLQLHLKAVMPGPPQHSGAQPSPPGGGQGATDKRCSVSKPKEKKLSETVAAPFWLLLTIK